MEPLCEPNNVFFFVFLQYFNRVNIWCQLNQFNLPSNPIIFSTDR